MKCLSIKKVAVIGAGVMGSSTALDLVLHGKQVVLVDISEEILKKTEADMLNSARMAFMMNPKLPKMSKEEILENVLYSTSLQDIISCELIIENITEDWDKKKSLYKQIEQLTNMEYCIAANSSCISITQIASLTDAPEKVIGVHFMNPVYLKKTVEVIKGYHTSESTIEEIEMLLKDLGKQMIAVNDFPGYVSNRISHLFMNEAAFVVQDQVATPEQVDNIFKKCYGHAMGPLETADLIGLDTVVNSLDVLYDSYYDTKFRCCPLLKKMVHAGLLGRKSGKGFYQY